MLTVARLTGAKLGFPYQRVSNCLMNQLFCWQMQNPTKEM